MAFKKFLMFRGGTWYLTVDKIGKLIMVGYTVVMMYAVSVLVYILCVGE